MFEENEQGLDIEFDMDPVQDPNALLDAAEEESDVKMSEDVLGPAQEDVSDTAASDLEESSDNEGDSEAPSNVAGAESEEATSPSASGNQPDSSSKEAAPSNRRPPRAKWVDRAAAARIYRESADSRQINASDVLKFASAVNGKSILEGRISGVVEFHNEVCWTIYEGNVTVRIPYAESYTNLEPELLNNTRSFALERQRQLMSQSIGVTVPYVPESLIADPENEDCYIVYASRTSALERHRKIRFFGDDASRRVSKGDDIDCQIISSGPNAAYVCACGQDIRVINFLLTHRYVGDVSKAFFPGDHIVMRVTEIEENPADRFCPTIHLSARPVEIQKFKWNLKHRIPRKGNPRFNGTITSIRTVTTQRGPKSMVYLFLDGVDVPAYASTSATNIREDLKRGDNVTFEVWGALENGYAHGRIIRYNSKRKP